MQPEIHEIPGIGFGVNQKILPGDPEAGAKIQALLGQFIDAARAKYAADADGTFKGSVRIAHHMALQAFEGFRTFGMSAVAGALGAKIVRGGTIRVEQAQDTRGFNLEFWAKPDGSDEVLVARALLAQPAPPTATQGVTYGMWLHLTPSGSAPLWDLNAADLNGPEYDLGGEDDVQ